MTIISGSELVAPPGASETSRSAVSWPSIFAGAVAAISATLILFALGSGLGFATASPWPGSGATATTFVIGTGIWLIVTQWLSSALGGYMAGRLRTRWVGVHVHEVFFRDTAHGLLAWAVATLIVAAVAIGATASTASATANTVSYTTDTMLRSDRPVDAASAASLRAEVGRVLSREGPVEASDKAYLTAVVAKQTGVSQPEAARRVDVAIASIRDAADKARKVASALGFFTALSMVIGAFIASVAAGYAGRLRDDAEAAL